MVKKDKKLLNRVIICSVSALLLAASLTACGNKDTASSMVSEPEPEPISSSIAEIQYENINPLTGENNLADSAKGQRPIAVMINNNPSARPHWGLCSADIVIEGLVEGGATRMMWLFSDVSNVPKIGSVRSMRHDFVELANGLDAILVHWGGSPQAYTSVSNNNINHIDGISDSKNFFRDKTRNVALEHTGYTTGQNIMNAVSQKGFKTNINPSYASPFKFEKPDVKHTLTDGICKRVDVYFSSYGYNHTFTYNESDGLYYNSIEGTPMTQEGGEQMAVTNVIGLYTNVQTIAGDSANRMDMDLSGGEGFYISNGTYETITWKKGNTPSNPLKLYDKNGNELVLNAGKSWIGLLPSSYSGSTVISAT